MPKWTISLLPNSDREARLIDPLPEPFGFSRDVTAPHVENPKKKEMIENVRMLSVRNSWRWPLPPKCNCS